MNGLPLPDRARWLLEACLRDDGRAIEAFGKWRRFADPERMDGRELRLTPLLHANMRRLGLSDPKLAWIGGQAKHIWLAGALRRRKLMPVLDMLESAGIDLVLIKGAALIARFPKAVGNRPMGDFDLLIRRSSARAGMALLNASGWSGPVGAAFSDADLNRFNGCGFWNSTETSIDLHWRPTTLIATSRHAEGVRERSVAATLESRPVLVASATDHLFILLCHAFHGRSRAADRMGRRPRSPLSPRPARRVELADVSSARTGVPARSLDPKGARNNACDHRATVAAWRLQASAGRADVARLVAESRDWYARPTCCVVVRSSGARRTAAGRAVLRRDAIDRTVRTRARGRARARRPAADHGRNRSRGRGSHFPTRSSFSKVGHFRRTDGDGRKRTSACSASRLRSERPASHSDADAARRSSRASRPADCARHGLAARSRPCLSEALRSAEVFVVSGRLLPRADGEKAAPWVCCGCAWTAC